MLRKAGPEDRDLLVELMTEFYREGGFPIDVDHARRAFAELLADERLGQVWLMDVEGSAAGYAVLTFGYSMEYGGRDAFVDDLFVRAPHRGKGLGQQTLEALRGVCATEGVRALHLEVGRDNPNAQRLYRNFGFIDHDRLLLTLRLAKPTHEP